MARQISRTEAWERAHEIFTQVNFSAFDFNSIKESLLDYVKLYFPEDFNDYIESSEFIAVLELFAYVGELLSYRLDLNAHENFITTAERKESILRLAKLISYKASRNIPARGLVKMSSIQTTETVIDSQGRNLSGRRIFWNDVNNSDWKEQFLLVMNRVLEQEFGTVAPDERVQIDDVLFELYTLNNNPISQDSRSVFPFSATADGENTPMELVPVELQDSGPQEKRPELNAKFSLLYANDGLGDSSDTTGFLFYTKQGTLAFQTQTFDGVTPNQTFDLTINNINETDLWVNNVNSDTGEVLVDDPFAEVFPHLVAEDLRYGEWIEVDLANAQNIIFNTNRNRQKYETETLDNDQVRLIFGDGEFSNIPSGTFHLWYRTSANKDFFIEKSAVIDQTASFTYTDVTGSVQTITFTFSLISSLQNASASEDIEHIRRVAPSVYYTQDRMVNGRDYNTFMLQDPSILRLRAINRTYAGDSKYIAWHDPRENYEDVKIFGDDLALYWDENEPESGGLTQVNTAVDSDELLEDYIEPLLSSTDFFSKIGPYVQELGGNPGDIRRTFNDSNDPYTSGINNPGEDNERDAIIAALDLAASTTTPTVYIWYSPLYDEWVVGTSATEGHKCDLEVAPAPGNTIPGCISGTSDSFLMIVVEAQFQSGSNLSGWTVRWRTRRLIAQSMDTRFWDTNTTDNVISFDTLNTVNDTIVVLEANKNAEGDGLLDNNLNYGVIGQVLFDDTNSGLRDINRLSVLPEDQNNDNIPDDLLQGDIFDASFTYTWTGSEPTDTNNPAIQYVDVFTNFGRRYNNSEEKGWDNDIKVTVIPSGGTALVYSFENGGIAVESADGTTDGSPLIANTVAFTNAGGFPTPSVGDTVIFEFYDYVYFSRDDTLSVFEPQIDTDTIRTLFLVADTEDLYKREPGRYPLNFAWFHYTPRLNLVDPAASNIIDIYITTVGYYTALTRWLANRSDVEPTPPTPLELRTSYADLLDSKMISDTVVLHPGLFKIMFGSRAVPQLRCTFKVIRPVATSLTDNQVKVRIVEIIRQFFDIDDWEFGETFFFTELAASIHAELGPEIDSVVLVPTYAQNQFGDMFQVQAREDEIFIPDISTTDIEIIQSITPDNIRQEES